MKERPWAKHLTSLPERGVSALSSVSHMKVRPCHVYSDPMASKQITGQTVTYNGTTSSFEDESWQHTTLWTAWYHHKHGVAHGVHLFHEWALFLKTMTILGFDFCIVAISQKWSPVHVGEEKRAFPLSSSSKAMITEAKDKSTWWRHFLQEIMNPQAKSSVWRVLQFQL